MKASMADIFVIIVILGVFFVSLVFGLKLYNNIDDAFWQTSSVGPSIQNSVVMTMTSLDYGVLFLTVGLFISTIASAFFIQTHPIFFVISLILLVISVVIAAIMSNAFMGIATSNNLKAESESLPISVAVVGNLPLIMTVLGAVLMIALYAKYSGGTL